MMKIEFYTSKRESEKVKALIFKISIKKTFLGVFYQTAEIISGLLVLIGIMCLVPSTLNVYKVFPTYIICLALFTFGVLIFNLSSFYVNHKLSEKSGLLTSKICYEIYPDKIVRLIDDGLKTEIASKEILEFIDHKNYLLIFIRENVAYYIPTRAFSEVSERQKIKNEIEKMINYSSLNPQ